MRTPEVQQYENITSHLRYLNEKIIQAFSLYIKLATAVVGGVFFLHWKLPPKDAQRAVFGEAISWFFIIISASMIFLIINNLLAWRGYRVELSTQYPDIPLTTGFRWWIGESIMCLLIATTCIGFFLLNPLCN